MVKAGIFWAVPNGAGGQSALEFSKSFTESEADANGFINYPYSHYEVWDDEVKGLGNDCYKFPRGRILYDTKTNKHRIFADECVSEETVDELVNFYGIKEFELCRDEHYTCPRCAARRRREERTLSCNILRGKDKIGENLIEISYGGTTVLVELGRALDGGGNALEKEILKRDYAAVVVSHYHEDHAGLIEYKRDCPVYLGHGARKIVLAMLEYRKKVLPENLKSYQSGRPFKVGGIKITPYLCDHSAFDSYMLLFEAGGKSVLYTGDFRFHGRKGSERLLAALPKSVDVLIHEGTNRGKNACTMSETELENQAVSVMRATDMPVFVVQSGTNIDRLVSIYRASKRSGRLFYMDNYVSLIASAAGGSIPRPDVFRGVVAFTPVPLQGRRKDLFLEIKNKRGIKGIAGGTKRFTMLVRPSMLGYLKKLFAAAGIEKATLIYSLWNGYKEREDMAKFLHGMAELGAEEVDLHTSGHASEEDIELLKKTVNAKETVCVHTEGK